jgi:phenylpyruvate tautomerase PptA (4-oxalocrotonate tautomerase family)
MDEDRKNIILSQLSSMVAECFNKPETDVMIIIDEKPIMMSGKTDPAAFACLKSIGGINSLNNRTFSTKLCAFLKDQLNIEQDKIYINFVDVDAENWGWNGQTFA